MASLASDQETGPDPCPAATESHPFETTREPDMSETNDAATGAPKSPKVNWDASKMHSSYANVANVTSTREEVTLFFGMNQNWQPGQDEVTVELTQRLIVSPYAAARLHALLGGVLQQYESRFGKLPLPGQPE